MVAPPSPDPAELMDELVEQFLLLLPPEDPADLARAALVSRQWHRVATGAVFRRRYIEFHRSPPLLGYIEDLDDSIRFVSTSSSSSFRPRRAHRRDVEALHSSHGRILLCSTRDRDRDEFKELDDIYLFVWDPVRDEEWALPALLSTPGPEFNYAAALVCAVGDGCSHLNCHFKVVVVGISGGRMFSTFYSSKSDSWSDGIIVSGGGFGYVKMESVLVGNALYFRRMISHRGQWVTIIKYDLPTDQMSMISLEPPCEVKLDFGIELIATEDGRLGLAMINNSTLCLWVREEGRLAENRVIQLHGLLPDDSLRGTLPLYDAPRVIAFADTRAGGVIFLRTCVGYFTIDLNSGRSKKVGECLGSIHIVPYMSFCTPASGIVSTDEERGASVVVTTDDEPGVGVVAPGGDAAVSTYEEPGDVVASTDEGQEPSMSGA